jgi:hypothetical protein
MYFHLPTTAYAATFCLYNNYLIFFILLNKTDRYYALKDILYQIWSLEASIQGEKIVNNNLTNSIV